MPFLFSLSLLIQLLSCHFSENSHDKKNKENSHDKFGPVGIPAWDTGKSQDTEQRQRIKRGLE